MAIVVVSMMVIVFAAVGVLVFVCALHIASTSPRIRGRVRRLIFASAAKYYIARRAARYRMAPVVARVEERLAARAASSTVTAKVENAGQQ